MRLWVAELDAVFILPILSNAIVTEASLERIE